MRSEQRTRDLQRFVAAFDHKHTVIIEPQLPSGVRMTSTFRSNGCTGLLKRSRERSRRSSWPARGFSFPRSGRRRSTSCCATTCWRRRATSFDVRRGTCGTHVRHQRPAWTMREGQGVCAEAGRRSLGRFAPERIAAALRTGVLAASRAIRIDGLDAVRLLWLQPDSSVHFDPQKYNPMYVSVINLSIDSLLYLDLIDEQARAKWTTSSLKLRSGVSPPRG